MLRVFFFPPAGHTTFWARRGVLVLTLVVLCLGMLLVLPQPAWATEQGANTTPPGCDSCRIVIDQLEQPTPLSGKWLFTRNDTPENKQVDLDTSDWRLAQTPGRWGGIYPDDEKYHVGWYRGVFEFSPDLVGQEVVLLFNAYMARVTVYVDGVRIYKRPNNVNVERYYSIQPIPIRFKITQPRQVIAIRVDSLIMTGVYQLPFELHQYSPYDKSLSVHQFWSGDFRVIASYVILFFGIFFYRIYTKSKVTMYRSAALTTIIVFPFFTVPGDYLLRFFTPETLLAVHYIGLYALFTAYLFCQSFYKTTPKTNWILGSVYAVMALVVPISALMGSLSVFQSSRSLYFLTGAACISLAFYQTVRAALQKKQGAVILSIGTFTLLVTALHDMLLATGIITSLGLTSFGAIGFMISMLYVASTTFTNTYLENQQLVKDLGAVNENLEHLVAERVEDLSITIQTLQQTQHDLVEAEKLASLGALVAGISHELNTPIGNAMVAASALQDQMNQMQVAIADGQLRKSTLTEFMRDGASTAELVFKSCERASSLVRSFKQVAVDQTSEQRRTFNLKALVNDVVTMLKPTFRHDPWHIDTRIPDAIECDSYPGPLGQVLNNLVQNAIFHAFEGRDHGHLHLSANCTNGMIEICCEDDGRGMTADVLAHIFEPFFTTRLGKGGSGLGLSVSRNIAVGVLGGTLTASSIPEMGTCFVLTFPVVAPVPSEGE
ncbi:MAG: hypothetical protein IPH37_03420 [Burkholderiales bacterium]|nr:hypothetical protein [Burkholderiales bacterium]